MTRIADRLTTSDERAMALAAAAALYSGVLAQNIGDGTSKALIAALADDVQDLIYKTADAFLDYIHDLA